MEDIVGNSPSWQLDAVGGVLRTLSGDDSGEGRLIDGRALAVKA
jgi:hypothetical protein